jgi:hypothetical protein
MRATPWIGAAVLLWACGPGFEFDNPCDPDRTDRPYDPCECGNCGEGYRCEAKAAGDLPFTCTCDSNLECGEADAKACCGAGQVCHQQACCTPDCAGRACGDDGCGGFCRDGAPDPRTPATGACEGCGNRCVDHACLFDPCVDGATGEGVCGDNPCGGSPACECVDPEVCDDATSRCKAP